MALNKLGLYIEQIDERNSDLTYGLDDVKGMTITKEIIPTKADIKEKELPKFWVVGPQEFIYNPRTHGKKIGLGFNDADKPFIISWNNIAFRIKKDKTNELNPYYLFIFFKRNEWDREATFMSWGSSTEVFSWDTLCDMELEIPPIEIQRKYVAIYQALKDNQKAYEKGLDDLKLVCDGYIEDLRRKMPSEPIGKYLKRKDEKNTYNKIKNVMGVSVYKEFRKPTSKVNVDELTNYKIVKPKEISFVQTTHNEKVFAYALNNTKEDIVVSSVNEVFSVNQEKLLPEFLSMFFSRTEFDRYARFKSWGSARETFTWNDLLEVKIPIPKINIQEDIVKIHNSYIKRKFIADSLKEKLNNICPVLIAGAIKETKSN